MAATLSLDSSISCSGPGKCGVCEKELSKYKCPRCSIKTCSLPCVKKHKTVTQCDGQRDRCAFVGLGEFSERHLLNDYVLLEQATRTAEQASKSWFVRQRERPKHLVSLIRESFHRGIKVYLLPFGTSRRMNNASFFHFGERVIYWQVEWLFLDAGAKFVQKRVNEKDGLSELLERRFCTSADMSSGPADASSDVSSALERQRLNKYLQKPARRWRLHLLQEKRRADQPRYWRLDSSETLQQALKGAVITEHPRIYVTLPDSKFKFKLMKGSKEKKEKKKKSLKEAHDDGEAKNDVTEVMDNAPEVTDKATEVTDNAHEIKIEAPDNEDATVVTDSPERENVREEVLQSSAAKPGPAALQNCRLFLASRTEEREEGEMSD